MYVLVISSLFLCGCNKSIMINEADKYTLTRLSASEIEYETYYVKDGSSFYPLYEPKSQGKGFYVIDKELSLIPEYYKGELLAFKSKKLDVPGEIPLKRMRDGGFTVGIYGIQVRADGLYFNADKNTIKGYDAQNKFKRTASSEILLLSIDDKPATEYTVTEMGTIDGLTENQVLSITCLVGTEYMTGTIVADVHIFLPFEEYDINDVSTTRNGYAAFRMNPEAKSGYYVIGNAGMFRYHQEEKGKVPDNEDFSVSNYNSPEDMLNARYQQQAIIVSTLTYSVGFNVRISDKDKDKDIKCVLLSPSGVTYELEYDEVSGEANILLAEVEAGRWTMNIYPKNIAVEKVNVDRTNSTSESILYTKTITVDEIMDKARFSVSYTGKGKVWGTVTNTATLESKSLDSVGENISCEWNRLEPGEYEVMVYHYVDTYISDITLTDETETGGEVIIVEN